MISQFNQKIVIFQAKMRRFLVPAAESSEMFLNVELDNYTHRAAISG